MKDSARKAMFVKNAVFVHSDHRGQNIKLLGDVKSDIWYNGNVSWGKLNSKNSKNFRVNVDGSNVFKSDDKNKAHIAYDKLRKQ